MTIFKHLTIGTLLDLLDSLPGDIKIIGLTAESDSYRVYYEHVAIEPGGETTVQALRDHIRSKVGTVMQGYKGGDFDYDYDCHVFVAPYGGTGDMLCGLIPVDDHLETLRVEEAW